MAAGGVTDAVDFVGVVGGGGVVVVTGFGVDFAGRDAVLVTAATGVEAMVVGVATVDDVMFAVVGGVGEDVCVVVLMCALRSAGTGDVPDPTFAGSGAGAV